MKIITVRNIDSFVAKIRPKTTKQNKQIVEKILSDVQKNGDSAIKKYEIKFGSTITSLRVSKQEIQYAYSQVSKNEITSIKEAKKRLEYSEKLVKSKLKNFMITNNDVQISKVFSPIDSVGCYVPGGLAIYPSSVVMSVVPAKIAGVKRIVVVSPPNKSGKIDSLILVAADICGANEIFKTGGAQAIAALSYGTKSIKSVDKIVGPGGAFVTLAKNIVSENTAIDMLAGPTELGIIADSSSNENYIAADLFSQAEHSKDTFCYVITNSQKKAKDINQILNKKIKNLKRIDIIKSSLRKNGFIAICKTKNEMIELANKLAPEHLEILTKNQSEYSNKIKSPGLILIGENTPSSVSDYLLGSNHILPTNGFGKTRGSLSILDFIKLVTKVKTTKKELKKIQSNMKTLTNSEGLPNHYKSIRGKIMKNNWFTKKVNEYSKLTGYVKPELYGETLKLDSNENFVIPKHFQTELLNNARKNSDIREYPLGGTEKLVQLLSKYLKIPASMIGVGNGSDQILDLILTNFASKQTKILTSDPTFGFFEERCKLYSIPTVKIPFSKDMKLDVSQFVTKSKNSDILYLDMPNNPTGFQFQKNDLEKLVKNYTGLVIIDEAYVEFADYSTISWTKKYDNLIVVQTFSKSFGLAGLRLGYFIANKTFTEVFNRVIQYPYPINTIAIEVGIISLQKIKQVKESIETIKKERKRIIENLRKYDAFEVFDSKANFVLFDARGADKRVYTALIEQGISIRKLGKIGKHEGCLRVTIGTKEMNSKFLLAIRDLLG